MQKKARDGQEHWLSKVKKVREVWSQHPQCSTNPNFKEQVEACTHHQKKSQQECLLRTLQLSAADGMIKPLAWHTFSGPGQDEGESFLGWTGFQVAEKHAEAFKARIEDLFPETPQENTLHTTFRRAGIVPDKWKLAW
eukprot:CAMPEP_0173402618 /NCGR_PEP_ID=MMETSP1356-20130122/54483_1 /TAXON_ID=77927 ORGANISM="Hemiselmis virescens, Strain PCC157" /NCGR_SAMPLE_ID=MMETSP1356 /ASSEMBLY_ACC=CAM_ASM_000847 /LENGTH=137 /DNA_ID=CAMNT_0014362997 /DNA_START=21 /DNA_END=431 /DNA_ORIENTATION=-